ncbi:MAG: molybdopterin molybdenumtransferase MoeA, partial [Pseudomonadota bacterium]
MTPFDTIVVADWSAAKRAPPKPSKDAIWIAVAADGAVDEPMYMRSRMDAEAWLTEFVDRVKAEGRRALLCFDFPFGYPAGFARQVTGS